MNDGRLAARDDDHALLSGIVGEAALETRARVEEAAGPIRGLILGGSLARGEGTVWRGAGGKAVLSDLDLAVVLPGERARDRAAGVADAIRAGVTRRMEARGGLGGFDLGVYAPADLGRQGPRPGTLEYRMKGRVLVGPADLTAGFPALKESDVPPEEALVLLENRGAELLLAWPGSAGRLDEGRALKAMYAGLKTVLDGAFALVLVEGHCPAGVQARQAALESWTTVEGRSETLRAVLPDFLGNTWLDEVRFWGAMKLAPDPVAIAHRLLVSDPADVTAMGRRAWREGARTWVACYRMVASRLFGLPGASPILPLAAHAAHRARLRRRVRRWWETARAWDESDRAGRARWALRQGPARVRLALAGAPEHQLASTIAVLLAAWTSAGSPLAPDWRETMMRGFPGECPERLEWDRCRQAAVRLWDTIEGGGARTAWEVPDLATDARAFAEDS